MTCASCVKRVEDSIKKITGVKNVAVNLATEKAQVTYAPGNVKESDIIKAVKEAGYKLVKIYDGQAIDLDDYKKRKELRRQYKGLFCTALNHFFIRQP